jgi:aerotolerance regulator-like protein/VWA domain-containing protein
MDFLTPLFLAGAAAVALPILFHLIRKTTNEKTIFSSLMFLLPTPPKVTRRSRLDNILLLLLRCGVLCLLAVGFARPYLLRPAAAGGPSGPGKKVVVLVDTSASMRRDNLWAQARERVNDVLGRLGPADEVALFAFDDRVTEILSIEEWRKISVSERRAVGLARLNALAPTWHGTHLANALLSATEALEDVGRGSTESRPTERAREIVVVTDLQQGSRLDGLQGFEWSKGLIVRVEALKAKRPSNAGIHLLEERDDVGPTAELNRRIRVVNSGDARKEQFKIAWAGGTNAPIETYVPPGQSRILQLPPVEARSGQLILTGDDEDFDNHLYWVGARQAQVNVAYLGTEAENDTAQPPFYLKRAFQQTARQDVRITNQTAGATLCIMSGSAGTPRPTNQTVLVVLTSPASGAVVSQILNLPQLSCEEAFAQKYSLLVDIDFTHPLFKPFADPRFSDFTKIHFWKHRRLDAQQIPNARVLARFDDGDPALIEVPRIPQARDYTTLILTSGWHPSDSQLALSSKFVPLLYSLLEYSSTERPLHLQFEVGQALPDQLKAGVQTNTDAPGIYAAGDVQFAVNLPAAESRTAPMTIDELEQLGVPVHLSSPQIVADQKRVAQRFQAAEAENQQKLWRWLIVGALAFVLGETLLAGRLTGPASATFPSPPEPR